MSVLVIVLLVISVVFLALLIFWGDFRRWVGSNLQALGLLLLSFAPSAATWLSNAILFIGKAIGIYSIVLLGVTAISLFLMVLALFINSPGFTAFTFVLGISAVLMAWLPAGILLRLFHITDGVVPKTLKMLVAWTAFVGFLGLMCPDVLTAKTLMGAALVGFIFLGIATKINALDMVVFPLVVVMCLGTAYGYFFPESYRSNFRWAESVAKKNQATKDRSSIDNETSAATTYGVALKDIAVLYTCSHDTVLNDAMVGTVKMGTIVKIVSRKQEIRVIDGQGFIQIQLANKKGSFVRAEKYYVEAEYVQLATPRQITPEDDSLFKKKTSLVSTNYVGGKFLVGEHTLALQNGQESDWCSIQDCHSYTFLRGNSCRFILTYEDGTTAESWGSIAWPAKYKFKVKTLSAEMPVLKVI